jgi:hypothetical protein
LIQRTKLKLPARVRLLAGPLLACKRNLNKRRDAYHPDWCILLLMSRTERSRIVRFGWLDLGMEPSMLCRHPRMLAQPSPARADKLRSSSQQRKMLMQA